MDGQTSDPDPASPAPPPPRLCGSSQVNTCVSECVSVPVAADVMLRWFITALSFMCLLRQCAVQHEP